MFPLQTHLSAVSLEKEVSKFSEGDRAAVVGINSEKIFHNIVNLTLRLFLENINNDLLDALDINFILGIDVFGK